MYRSVVIVVGVARSGTSFLGELLNSSPVTKFVFQPFFSYEGKDDELICKVNMDSSKEELAAFLKECWLTDDDYRLQKKQRREGIKPSFIKAEQSVLVIKTCRYQYLLSSFLHHFDDVKLIGIVRHPCAVMNSWFRTPADFPRGSDELSEWFYGACKNEGRPENFYGFAKWREVANLYIDLQAQFGADRVAVLRYETLACEPASVTARAFRFAGLEVTVQTEDFIRASQETHQNSLYSVYKDPERVVNSWMDALQPQIVEHIYREIEKTRLAKFL